MDRLFILADLISCVYVTNLWVFATDGTLISTNCSHPENYSIFMDDDFFLSVKAQVIEHSKPSLFQSRYHTTWLIDSFRNEKGLPEKIVAFGPIYPDSFPDKTLSHELDNMDIPLSLKFQITDLLRELPVIPFTKILEYGIMIHYAITGQKIFVQDMHYSILADPQEKDESITVKKHGTYAAEQEMLRMVREGDLSLLEKIKTMFDISNVGKLSNDNSEPLRQIKNVILVSIVLFSRAAIEGGVYPDTAMTLTDHYFQAVEAARTYQEIFDIGMTMEQDFVHRVHKIKTSSYSKPTRNLIDYIELNLEENIILSDISSEMGYSEYYLTKLFKKETGTTFKEYIREKRLEKASTYLKNTSLSVNEISEKLHFSSTSYFIDSFRKKYGITPSEFRKN